MIWDCIKIFISSHFVFRDMIMSLFLAFWGEAGLFIASTFSSSPSCRFRIETNSLPLVLVAIQG